MAGLCSNIDLFMKLRSFGDMKNWKSLYEFIISELPHEISEEDDHKIKEFTRLIVLHMQGKWKDSSRTLKQFINKNESWLERDICWPECQSINLRTVFGGTKENPIEESDFVQAEVPGSLAASSSTCTRKPFEDLSNRQKKRRSVSFVDDHSEDELLYLLCSKLKENGKKNLAKTVEELVKNSVADIPEPDVNNKRRVSSGVTIPEDKALALCTAISLSKWQYLTLRTLLMEEGSCVLPSYHNILRARKRCYPIADCIEVTETGASIRLQALVDHTTHRILQNLGPVAGDEELKMIWKWGLDGSSSQSNYKQRFSESEFNDSSVVMTSAVPLRLVGIQTGSLIWENPCPGSTSYCRPVKFNFKQETAEFIKEVESDMRRQIGELVPSQLGGAVISHEMHMTMIDGKVSNTIADVPSSATCPICLAKPSEMNNLGLLDTKPVREDVYKHGLSSLNMKIRCMECLLHISYNMDFERWSARGPFKRLKEAKKAATQKEFREVTGLVIDVVKQWYRIDKSNLSTELLEKYVQLDPDEETKEFLSNSIDKSTWVWTQMWYLIAKAVLKHFWSITDINGWLGRGSMFVLSEAQAQSLLSKARANRAAQGGGDGSGGSLVDIGAGDGEVSRRFAHLYTDKYATEISGSMRKVLNSKGYKILDTDDWWRGGQFDCVCMMNLLDRCSRPRTMLRQARAAIAPSGVLLLALVLPYKPYVEVTADHKPEERIPITGVGFEEQVASFIKFMSEEAGFELAAWTRAPYLCEGDFAQAYYWLDDSVYVFSPKTINPQS